MMIKSVFFDLDNTLVNRPETLQAYAGHFIQSFKGDLRSSVSPAWLFDQFTDIDNGGYRLHSERARRVANLPIWLNHAPPESTLSEHWQHWVPSLSVPMAGYEQCLTELCQRGFKLGLITNGQSKNQRIKIKKLKLDSSDAFSFETFVISQEAGMKKPSAQIFERAMSQMNSSPDSSVYLGDHPINDCIGSLSAGMTAVWFKGSHDWPTDQPRPAYEVSTLEEFTNLVVHKLDR